MSAHGAYEGFTHPINFNLGVIRGGEWPSSVPTECTFQMRVGFFPGVKPAVVRAEIENTIQRAAAAHPGLKDSPPTVQFVGFQAEGCTVDPNEAMMRLLAEVHRRVMGAAPALRATTATTDARFFQPLRPDSGDLLRARGVDHPRHRRIGEPEKRQRGDPGAGAVPRRVVRHRTAGRG